jgi:glutamyl-tRNA synthetase
MNYLFAKRHGGDFLLRVEDTDSGREVEGAIKYITDSFNWLGIMPSEGYGIGGEKGPYIQSERTDIYNKHVAMLIENGSAYYAFDTKEDLAKMRADFEAAGITGGYTGTVRDRMKNSLTMSGNDVKAKIDSGEPYTIRFKMPRAEDVKFHDEIRGWVKFNTKDLDDKVIWKSSDGLPTYHLANVIDDHLMEITHIIRGEEWVSSTPLHVLLYRAFGWELPVFAHLPLILGDDSKKLGKRHGDKYGYPIFPLTWDYVTKEGESVHVTGFRDEGYEPDALLNFLVLLGWNPKTNDEIMSIKDMAKLFSLEGVNKSGAMFDKNKLMSFNSHYLRSRDADSILSEMTDMPEDFLLSMDHDKLDLIASMAVERVEFSHELKDSLSYIYNTPTLEGEIKMKNVEEFIKVMNVFVADDFMSNFEEYDWIPKNIRHELEHISGNMNIGVGKIMPMLRVAICGGASGPQLPDVMYVIGSKETKARIEALLNKIKELA